jgi:erythromycin esterase
VSEIGSFLSAHAIPLTTLDPTAPLDDLDPLADLVGDARVVAVGESAHFLREYTLLRHRLLRFLVERCGFTAFGLESGFSEGRAVDAWVRGGPGDLDAVSRTGVTNRMGHGGELRDQLRWMRSAGVPYVGLDVPGSSAAPLTALHNVRGFVESADPAALSLVDRLIEQVEAYADEHTLVATGRYTALDRTERDAMTAGLSGLAVRLDALPRGSADDRDAARHELRLAVLLDQTLRGHAAMALDGDTVQAAASPRDRAMAETVLRTLDRGGPGTRIVVGAANGHIQRIPYDFPTGPVHVAGTHLADALGDAYIAIAGTATAGTTTTRRRDASAPGGVAVVDVELGEPEDGSIEALLPGPAVADLRGARGRMPGPDRLRLMDTYQHTSVLDAFDLVAVLDRISPDERA